MKNDFLKNSSQRVLFSAFMASALIAGNLTPMHAEMAYVQSAMQSVSVKGQVLDGSGMPVIGASVLEKGTSNGVITDIDGNYSLKVSSKSAVIVISYIGYKTQNVKVGSQNTFAIKMESDNKLLDEVVVIGYGTSKRSDLTGSVVSVKSDDIMKTPTSDVTQALAGRVAGVQVIQSTTSAEQPVEQPSPVISLRETQSGRVNSPHSLPVPRMSSQPVHYEGDPNVKATLMFTSNPNLSEEKNIQLLEDQYLLSQYEIVDSIVKDELK